MRFIYRYPHHIFKKLLSRECASASIEMAFVLPLFIAVFFGLVEFSRMMLIQQKLEKTVSAMGDFVTRAEFACSSEFPQFRAIAQNIMDPFSFASGSITFTSIIHHTSAVPPCPADVACISWQDGAGSTLGGAGDEPQNLGTLQVDAGHNYIVAEVNYSYAPLLAVSGNLISGIAPKQVYLSNIHKPRLGTLGILDPPECFAP